MKNFFFILLMLITNAWAEDDCMYSQEYQLEKLRKITKENSGAKLTAENRMVTWNTYEGAEIIYGFGGCDHLSHRITIVEHLTETPSEQYIFNKAVSLAKKYWDVSDAESLRRSLKLEKYEKEQVELETFYYIEHPDYAEFNVISEYQHNESRITIEFMRNF